MTQGSQASEVVELDSDLVVNDNDHDAELPALPSTPADLSHFSTDEKIDILELVLCAHPDLVELPIQHTFTPGLYGREVRAPAGTLATTYVHKTEHQFILSQGEVVVFMLSDTEPESIVHLKAPYHGVTKAGTRRVVGVVKDAVWTTFHPTSRTDVDSVEEEIYAVRTLPDGSNIKDRMREALKRKELASREAQGKLEG